MDKRLRSDLFRQRLLFAMNERRMNRSQLAREVNADRSTIGQLLKPDEVRLPNSQLIADCATALGVSSDWLLGLTDRPERPGDLLSAAMALTHAERSSSDAQILQWHKDATGNKIRHVPATLPDLLKTEAMLKWEYEAFGEDHAHAAVSAMNNQMDWFQSGMTDYEIAVPQNELAAFVDGSAYYEGLPASVRREQLELITSSQRDMYPRLRIFLYDARRVFSAPVTIFGSNLAVIYVGKFYLSFRESRRVLSLVDHFDWLVREATVDARQVPEHLEKLAKCIK